MSFLHYFFTKKDATSAMDDDAESVESNRRRLAAVRRSHLKHGAELDLGRRVAQLEVRLAEAGIVIETLIELLDERVGLSRREIETRLENLTSAPEEHIEPTGESQDQVPPAPTVLSVEGEKERFTPRRRWRDAKGLL